MFYAGERGYEIGEPRKTGSLDALMAALSQLGGYNAGFALITQRPAYVGKALLSQCNTWLCFRVEVAADIAQIASVSGIPTRAAAEFLPRLPDHRAYLDGMACPFEFPVFCETEREIYPMKAARPPSELAEALRAGFRLP